jgi:hypothetical protein
MGNQTTRSKTDFTTWNLKQSKRASGQAPQLRPNVAFLDSLGFQCQVVGPSHCSLTCMQDAPTTKQPAQNLFTAQKFQHRPPNEVGTTYFLSFPTVCIVLGPGSTETSTKRAQSSLLRRTTAPLHTTASRGYAPRSITTIDRSALRWC